MIKHILLFAVIMTIIDFVYLSSISSIFKKMLLNIQNTKPIFRYGPAIVVYISLVASWFYFIYPNIISKKRSVKENVIDAAALGFFIYSVFEFTNYATITKWSPTLVIIDSLWGSTLYAISTYLFIYLSKN